MSKSTRFDLLVIVGQTASGKSSLAMQIAKNHNGEIIAGDSRTVYQGLDIGTAKPSKEDQKIIRHHLIDIVKPDEDFNVAKFQFLTFKAIEDIKTRGKLPILVGGSGLYIDSVLFNYDLNQKSSVDQKLRSRLQNLNISQLQDEIQRQKLTMPDNNKNPRYLVRTLERGQINSKTLSFRKHTLAIGLKLDKLILKHRIEDRLSNMMDLGLIKELKWAYEVYPKESEALKGNIYLAFKDYIKGGISYSQACDQFIKLDLALAKKQLTWFKRNSRIKWFNNHKIAYDYVKLNLNNQ